MERRWKQFISTAVVLIALGLNACSPPVTPATAPAHSISPLSTPGATMTPVKCGEVAMEGQGCFTVTPLPANEKVETPEPPPANQALLSLHPIPKDNHFEAPADLQDPPGAAVWEGSSTKIYFGISEAYAPFKVQFSPSNVDGFRDYLVKQKIPHWDQIFLSYKSQAGSINNCLGGIEDYSTDQKAGYYTASGDLYAMAMAIYAAFFQNQDLNDSAVRQQLYDQVNNMILQWTVHESAGHIPHIKNNYPPGPEAEATAITTEQIAQQNDLKPFIFIQDPDPYNVMVYFEPHYTVTDTSVSYPWTVPGAYKIDYNGLWRAGLADIKDLYQAACQEPLDGSIFEK